MQDSRTSFVWLPIVIGMTVLVISLGVAVFKVTTEKSGQKIGTKATETMGSMGLSPAGGDFTLAPGETYPVGLVIDSAGKKIDGVDVIINFDPAKVQVTRELTPTTLFERVLVNKIDNTAGQIKFSALSFTAVPVSGIAATFSFKPKGVGEADFEFDFTAGSTVDSNMAENGTARDILGKVTDGRYNFK